MDKWCLFLCGLLSSFVSVWRAPMAQSLHCQGPGPPPLRFVLDHIEAQFCTVIDAESRSHLKNFLPGKSGFSVYSMGRYSHECITTGNLSTCFLPTHQKHGKATHIKPTTTNQHANGPARHLLGPWFNLFLFWLSLRQPHQKNRPKAAFWLLAHPASHHQPPKPLLQG